MALDPAFTVAVVSGLLVLLGTFLLTRKMLSKSSPKTLISKDVKYPLKLVERKVLTQDTRIFRFELPSPKHILGLPTGQHVFLSAYINNDLTVRPYTPISSDDENGYMDLLIKVYFKDVNPKFPKGGKMTQHLEGLNIGDTIDVRGPNGLLVYEGKGTFQIKAGKSVPPKMCLYKNLCMIAGGSGITPMYQMIRHIIADSQDATKMWLIFANQTEEDVLLREELDNLSINHADQFKVWYTVDRSKPDWNYGKGFVTAEMISAHFCPPGNDVLVTMCGPPPMIQFACTPALDKMNYSQVNRFTF